MQVLAVNSNPYERETHSRLRNESLANLTVAVWNQVQAAKSAGVQSITWQYLIEDDSSGTGFARMLLEAKRTQFNMVS